MGHDFNHFHKHRRPGRCVRCTWGKRKETWRRNFLVDASRTWVVLRKDPAGKYIFQCLVCPEFSTLSCQWHVLQRHHASRAHTRNVSRFLGLSLGPTALPTNGSPPKELFLQAWHAASHGGNQDDETARLQDCIHRALREQDHKFLRKATTMSIQREESKGMVIIRAQAATADLEVRSFILGLRQYDNVGPGAIDIPEVIVELLDAYAGEDAQLQQHMRNIIEAVCVDAAGVETKPARLMQTFPPSRPVAPNLKVVIRDRPHASRRLMTQPWQVDAKISDLTHELISGRHAIVQRIQHSLLFGGGGMRRR